MNPPPSRTCAACRHFFDAVNESKSPGGQCRRFPPDGGLAAAWPTVFRDAWCGEFAAAITQAGAAPKVPDEEIVEIVRAATAPLESTGGETKAHPEEAMGRSSLITTLTMDCGISSTAAYRRIQTLVKRGLLEMGDDPPITKETGARAPFLWLARGGIPQPAAAGRPAICTEADFLGVIAGCGALSPDSARSMRSLHKAAAETLPMSVTTAHRLLQKLVAAGSVLACEGGYYAVAPAEELP